MIDRLAALNRPEAQIAEQLRLLIPDLLSAEGRDGVTKAAKDFTLPEVVEVFGLNYNTIASIDDMEPHIWRIEDSKLDFTMTPCLKSLVKNYSKNFDRSSEAVCRTALDFILNECLTVLKGNDVDGAAEKTSDRQQKTPMPCDDIRIYGEVSFNHRVLAGSKTQLTPPSRLTVSGRLDYGIGRVIKHASRAEIQRRRRFQCFLVIVEAKAQFAVGKALPQLLVYLACLHQSRLQRNRTNASVYGVSSDGYQFVFVTITHDGTVKISRIFDILQGEMAKVLGCLTYMLETTAAMSPNVTPEKNGGDEGHGQDLDDPQIDSDDNDYTNPSDDED